MSAPEGRKVAPGDPPFDTEGFTNSCVACPVLSAGDIWSIVAGLGHYSNVFHGTATIGDTTGSDPDDRTLVTLALNYFK